MMVSNLSDDAAAISAPARRTGLWNWEMEPFPPPPQSRSVTFGGRWAPFSGRFPVKQTSWEMFEVLALDAVAIETECKTTKELFYSWSHVVDLLLTSSPSVPIPPVCPPPQFDHSFVEVHRVRKFLFQPRVRSPASADHGSGDPVTSCFGRATRNQGNGHGRWTCDGEILPHAAIRVR